MELWIRSQDGTLLEKVDRIGLYVAGGNISCNGKQFAHYKTRERAIAVLDEIQTRLNVIENDESGANYIILSKLAPIMYQMPKE